MSFVSSDYQRRKNAHLEHLAREVKLQANKRRLEVIELRRLDRQQVKQEGSEYQALCPLDLQDQIARV